MKAAAIIALIVAILLGVGAIVKFVADSNQRDAMCCGPQTFALVDKLDEEKRTDAFVVLIAVTFLIGSLVMFSKAKRQTKAATTAEGHNVGVEFRPNPNFKKDVLQAAGKKIQDALSITCYEHNQTARLENGKIVGCCDGLEKRVAEFLESS